MKIDANFYEKVLSIIEKHLLKYAGVYKLSVPAMLFRPKRQIAI